LCADIIKIFTKKNDLVLDPFMGVGGTLIGASISNRQAHGIEIIKNLLIYIIICRLDYLRSKNHIGDSKKEYLL
jgi:DNA modification methylase